MSSVIILNQRKLIYIFLLANNILIITNKSFEISDFNDAILSYELNFKKITLNELFKLDEHKMKEIF